jgi:Whirly transcription factor
MKDALIDTPPVIERPSEYAIYKPNSRGNGGVVRFELNRAKAAVFVDAASQSGEKQFDWENKITMKWGLPDLGTVLAALQGRLSQAKLFHQSEKANSAFDLTFQDDPDRSPYLLSISRQDSTDKSLRKVTIPLSHGEAAVLETALRVAVTRLLSW